MALTKATYSMISGAVFNVLDYGAIGDGVTDDTSAIQATITAALAARTTNAQGMGQQTIPGTVFFPAGTYLIGTTLNVFYKYLFVTWLFLVTALQP